MRWPAAGAKQGTTGVLRALRATGSTGDEGFVEVTLAADSRETRRKIGRISSQVSRRKLFLRQEPAPRCPWRGPCRLPTSSTPSTPSTPSTSSPSGPQLMWHSARAAREKGAVGGHVVILTDIATALEHTSELGSPKTRSPRPRSVGCPGTNPRPGLLDAGILHVSCLTRHVPWADDGPLGSMVLPTCSPRRVTSDGFTRMRLSLPGEGPAARIVWKRKVESFFHKRWWLAALGCRNIGS